MRPWNLLVLAGCLGFWGLSWGLPSRERLSKVLPPTCDTADFRERMEKAWADLHARIGPEPLLSPEAWSAGFSGRAEAAPGWRTPPELLLASARSFHLRSAFEDEADVLVALSRIRPRRLQFNPRLYTAYGGAYFMLLGLFVGLASLLTPLKLVASLGFYLANLDQLRWIYLAGRLLSVSAFVASVALAWRMGKQLWDEATGFCAALFFAVCPGNVFQAHYMKSHPVGVIALMGLFYFCGRVLRGDRKWIQAGLCLGVAAGATNYLWNAAVFLPLTYGLSKRRNSRDLIRASAAAALVYLATNPFLLLEFSTTTRQLLGSVRHAGLDASFIWKFPFGAFAKALTIPLALWSFAGLAAVEREDKVSLLFAAGLLYYFAFAFMAQSPDRLVSIRHFPAVFLGFLLAGRLVSRFGRPAAALAVACAAYAAIVSGAMDYNYWLEAAGFSTKDEAGAWIEANVKQGSELGFLHLPQPANAPYFRWDRYRLTFVERLDHPPERLILTAASYDDREKLGSALAKYRLEKEFRPARPFGLGVPEGEVYGNPVVSIYRRIAP